LHIWIATKSYAVDNLIPTLIHILVEQFHGLYNRSDRHANALSGMPHYLTPIFLL